MGQNPKYDRSRLHRAVSPAQQVLLVRLMEEASELQHACAKTLRWGWRSSNPVTGDQITNQEYVSTEMTDVADIWNRLQELRPGLKAHG